MRLHRAAHHAVWRPTTEMTTAMVTSHSAQAPAGATTETTMSMVTSYSAQAPAGATTETMISMVHRVAFDNEIRAFAIEPTSAVVVPIVVYERVEFCVDVVARARVLRRRRRTVYKHGRAASGPPICVVTTPLSTRGGG